MPAGSMVPNSLISGYDLVWIYESECENVNLGILENIALVGLAD